MLLDMIHDNHGEPAFRTRYRDPAVLAEYGFHALVIPEALAVLPSARPAAPGPGQRDAVAERSTAIDSQVAQAAGQGLQVFFYVDALLLPRKLVHAARDRYLCDDGSGRLCPAKPAVYDAYAGLLAELLTRWPEAAGVVVRSGEVYPETAPHMVGSALHESSCPACRALGAVARLTGFIQRMHAVVAGEHHRLYVHRAWQKAGSGATLHEDAALFRELAAGLPHDQRLLFSFKFTRGDFLAGQPANPCLVDPATAQRGKWIELQCEREFEGKGAFPNFQPVLWCDFLRSTGLGGALLERQAHPETAPAALDLWGWSRGGGWGGPYVPREDWIDANVFGLAELARNPLATPEQIARAWASRTFGVEPTSRVAQSIVELLLISPRAIERLLYEPAASARGHEAGRISWVRDDQLDVDALWASAARLPDGPAIAAACREKLAGLEDVEQMRQLFERIGLELPNQAQARDLANMLIFYNSFAGAVAHLYCGAARTLEWQRGGRHDAALAQQAADHLENAQGYWQHNTQRHAMLPGAPSVFEETSFWERTNDCLEELAGAHSSA